jgi:hypothetical protein
LSSITSHFFGRVRIKVASSGANGSMAMGWDALVGGRPAGCCAMGGGLEGGGIDGLGILAVGGRLAMGGGALGASGAKEIMGRLSRAGGIASGWAAF